MISNPVEEAKPLPGTLSCAVLFECELVDVLQLLPYLLNCLSFHFVGLLICAVLSSCLISALVKLIRIKAETDFLRLQLMATPTAIPAPAGVKQKVLQEALNVAWLYSISGDEQHRAGHTLAIGPGAMLLARGRIKGRNQWQHHDDSSLTQDPQASILTKEGQENLRIEMNQPGAHVVEGDTGQIIANKFLVSTPVSYFHFGGAGTTAERSLSTVTGSVVINISVDGSVTEFRNGALYHQYCASRLTPQHIMLDV